MALSWHFQPNRAPNSFMPFTWLIHGIFMALSAKNYFEIVISVLSCLCLSIYRPRIFSSFDIIFIDGFSGSGWSIFCVFSLIKIWAYKKHPNHQAKPTANRYLTKCTERKQNVVPAWHRACSVANRRHNQPRASLARQSFGPPRKSESNNCGRPAKLMAGTQTWRVLKMIFLFKGVGDTS